MSEENKEIQQVFSRKLCDHDLLKFADNANRYNFQVGVTLVCKGLMISGLIISGRDYYEGVADSFGPNEDSTVAFSNYFRNAAKDRYSPETYDDVEINFIHLKNVSVRIGDGQFGDFNKAFLRLKIEEIDGYIFGQPMPA